MGNGFAPPLNKLGESGIGVAAAPTGGMGLALGPDGRLPASVLPPVYAVWPSGTPDPGEEFIFEVDASGGVYWHFKFVPSQATYDWVFLGGPPLVAQVDTQETTTSTTYAALTTAGPSIALPRAGDYDVEIGCYMRTTTATASCFMSYDIGGTGAIDGNGASVDSAVASMGSTVARPRRLTGFSAVTLTSKYRVSAGIGTFRDRFLKVLPVRVS